MELEVEVVPQQSDEFVCMTCFLVRHRSQLTKRAVPVVALVGRSSLTAQEVAGAGFVAVHTISAVAPSPRAAMRDAARLLRQIAATAVERHFDGVVGCPPSG